MIRLTLLGRWRLLRDGIPVVVSPNGRRLLAFLALHGARDRAFVTGTLWPESSERRAHANLRTTLWRLRHEDADIVVATPTQLWISSASSDLKDLTDYATSLLADPEAPIRDDKFELLAGPKLLPGWYDDWVESERGRLAQLRLHALEVLSRRLLAAGRVTPALEAALAAVRIEPLRESARCAVIRAQIAEANIAEAVREFEQFRDLLAKEFDVEPSERISRLVAPYLRRSDRR
jgi:DNA-binding SARP family transcriptional activator